jgi:putative DNA primase/helicase
MNYPFSKHALNDLTNPDCERFVEYNRGKGITQRQLARLMQTFGIHTQNVKFPDGKVLKGYRREDLEHVFSVYLPQGDSNRYSATTAENKGDSPAKQPQPSATGSGLAGKRKTRKKGSSGVADKSRVKGDREFPTRQKEEL